VNELTISANLAGATYQWVECPTFDAITGETSQDFTASQNGDYAVIITDVNNCSDTSQCVTTNDVSITNYDKNDFIVYPNPTSNTIYIESNETTALSSVSILDSKGAVIKSSQLKSTITSIDLSDVENGIYFVQINSDDNTIVRKVVVQK
jgi:hypothetical protein